MARRSLLWGIIALGSFACGHAKDSEESAPSSDGISTKYEEYTHRYLSRFVEGGYTFSIKPDGTKDHKGEGLLWSGVALGALPCKDAVDIAADLVGWIRQGNGDIRRFEPMPDMYKGRELNFDEATGLLYGMAAFKARCPEFASEVNTAWTEHRTKVKSRDGELYPGSGEYVTSLFRYAFELMDSKAGMPGNPSGKDDMENAGTLWAASLHVNHAACYRVNLTYLHFRTIELLGETISQHGKDGFCGATRGMDIPLVDHWCGRTDLLDYVKQYQPNQYEYRHQRCGAPWEMPDGDGEETPGLDLLMAMKAAYQIAD